MKDRITRREFLELAGGGAMTAATSYFIDRAIFSSGNKEQILTYISELDFSKGSSLSTTIFPRKIMYEMAKLREYQGRWQGGDESDWMTNQNEIENVFALLEQSGFKSGRLVIVPFELTEDGAHYDFTPMETAIDLMVKHNLKVELCLGPIDYPYGPQGIRVPKTLQDLVNQSGITPLVQEKIESWGVGFLNTLLDRYGDDDRIAIFHVGNEWPDAHAIEGSNEVMIPSLAFMQEIMAICKSKTNKSIALNTNIHPSNSEKIKETFGSLLDPLSDRGILALDAYPTREMEDSKLRGLISQYGSLVEEVRNKFTSTDIRFAEFQFEPWPPDGVAGKPWEEIYLEDRDLVVDFYERNFADTLSQYVIASGIKNVGLWGAEVLAVFSELGYTFPLEIAKAISTAMAGN